MIAISGAETPLGKSLLSALDNKIGVLQLDITPDTDKGFFVDLFKTEKPSVFINLSVFQNIGDAEFYPGNAYNLHSYRVRDSAEAAAEHNCLYVMLSSSYIFNGRNPNPYKEEDNPDPLSVYGDSLLLGENFLKKSGCSYLILRAGDLFGSDAGLSSLRFIQKDSSNVIKVIKDMKISPAYIPDAAEAILKLIDIKATGIYNLSSSGTLSASEFINKAIELISKNENTDIPECSETDIKEMRFAAERPLNTSVSNEKIVSKTGSSLRSWDSALEDYIIRNKINEI